METHTGLLEVKGQGPVVGIIIVIIVLLVGAFYFFNRISWTGGMDTTPGDVSDIESELSAQNYDEIDAEMTSVDAELQ